MARKLSLALSLSTDTPIGAEEPIVRLRSLRQQTELARDSGFEAIVVGHHHSIGETQWLHPLLTLAALAPHAGDMEMGLVVYLAGHYHPVEVAEQLATLDAICQGRLRVGLAPGWTKSEYEALGISYEKRLPRFLEALDIIKALWSGERVVYEGRHFRIPGVRLVHLPQQRPHPPIWMGASTPKAARRVANMADSLVMSAHPRLDKIGPTLAAYRDELKRLAKRGSENTSIVRNCFVGDTNDSAWDAAAGPLTSWYGEFADAGLFSQVLQERWDDELETISGRRTTERRNDERDLLRGRAIVGNSGSVANELLMMQESLDVGRVFLRMQWPTMDDDSVLRSIELAGTQVRRRLLSDAASKWQGCVMPSATQELR